MLYFRILYIVCMYVCVCIRVSPYSSQSGRALNIEIYVVLTSVGKTDLYKKTTTKIQIILHTTWKKKDSQWVI